LKEFVLASLKDFTVEIQWFGKRIDGRIAQNLKLIVWLQLPPVTQARPACKVVFTNVKRTPTTPFHFPKEKNFLPAAGEAGMEQRGCWYIPPKE
jgi:hypothetical protein